MTHEDWLYLLECLLKRGDSEIAEKAVKCMSFKEPESVVIHHQRIIDAGFTPEYI